MNNNNNNNNQVDAELIFSFEHELFSGVSVSKR